MTKQTAYIVKLLAIIRLNFAMRFMIRMNNLFSLICFLTTNSYYLSIYQNYENEYDTLNTNVQIHIKHYKQLHKRYNEILAPSQFPTDNSYYLVDRYKWYYCQHTKSVCKLSHSLWV